MADHILKLEHITKVFPGVVALNDVSLEVERGKIHALIGENGAGKSTLIKVCSGAHAPTKGSITIDGETFSSLTPKQSEDKGIAVIYQELNSVNHLSVAENVFLGNEIHGDKYGITVDKKAMIREAGKLFQELDIDIDPSEMLGNLSVGFKQMVEIAKALSHDAKILIMDEPTSPLTNNEIEKMMRVVNQLKEKGVTIIYITHRLNEVFRLSDRISVMRDGQMIETLDTKDTDEKKLIALMVGRTMGASFPEREKKTIRDEVILELNNVTGNGDYDISFQLRRGEILGIAGLVGAGRTELAQMIFGLVKPQSGEIIWKGKKVNFRIPQDAIGQGMFLLPEDRKEQGCLLTLPIDFNITISSLGRYSRANVVSNKKVSDISNEYKDKLAIKTPSLKQLVKNLSGGNQQKVIIAKALATLPELLIIDEPTRGIDVGAKQEIYKICNQLLEEGKTILMISSEMEELIGMCDRIIVLAEGRLSGEISRNEFTQERIMELASVTYENEGA